MRAFFFVLAFPFPKMQKASEFKASITGPRPEMHDPPTQKGLIDLQSRRAISNQRLKFQSVPTQSVHNFSIGAGSLAEYPT